MDWTTLPWMTPELGLTAIVSAVSLVAVWVPFRRGLEVFFRARASTRGVAEQEIESAVAGAPPAEAEPMALLLVRTLRSALPAKDAEAPPAFLRDASRQYVLNEYEVNYSEPLTMYSNLLPPIGFIGTTCGLMLLFLSMHMSNDSLRLSALAFALTSSVFALIGFALLEGLKIRLYGRLLRSLEQALRAA